MRNTRICVGRAGSVRSINWLCRTTFQGLQELLNFRQTIQNRLMPHIVVSLPMWIDLGSTTLNEYFSIIHSVIHFQQRIANSIKVEVVRCPESWIKALVFWRDSFVPHEDAVARNTPGASGEIVVGAHREGNIGVSFRQELVHVLRIDIVRENSRPLPFTLPVTLPIRLD